MARRITIGSGENQTDEEYVDRTNGNWAALKTRHPDAGFHLRSDSVTTVPYPATGGLLCVQGEQVASSELSVWSR